MTGATAKSTSPQGWPPRAFELAATAMAVSDLDGRLLDVNPALCRLLERTAHELTGSTLESFVHPGEAGLVAAARSHAGIRGAVQLTELRCARPSEPALLWIDLHMTRLDRPGSPGAFLWEAHDVSTRKRDQEHLRHRALHDELTGLASRALFTDRLAHALARTERSPGAPAVLFLDLDGFKAINDTHGHQVGDAVLVQLAQRLLRVVRASDSAGRLGGDEFVVACEDLLTPRSAVEVATRLLTSFEAPISVSALELQVRASIGVTFSTSAAELPEDVIARADAAMYRAKQQGGAQVEIQ